MSTVVEEQNSTGWLRRAMTLVAATALLVLLVVASAFWLTGGRWFVVRTPSMGTAAPVGSLVLTRPANIRSLHVGDVISYHPPLAPGDTFTHRIVAVTDQGLRTRGDINGASDPWIVKQHDIVGRATDVPAVGWLLRALPLLLVGGLVIWGFTALWLAPARRGPIRMCGLSLIFALCDYLLRPFVNVVQLQAQSDPHSANITTVSTGLLPIRLTAAPGHGHAAPVNLSSAGKVGMSHFTGGRAGNQYLLQTHLNLSWIEWALLALFCVSPLLWTFIVGFHNTEQLRPTVRFASPHHSAWVGAKHRRAPVVASVSA